MSDGSISQDEIDALLSGVGGSIIQAAPVPAGEQLSSFKKNALFQFVKGNISGLSSNLESMTGASVSVEDPSIELSNREVFLNKVSEMTVASNIDFSGTLTGEHIFLMPPELAQKIVSLVNHEESVEIDDMALSVISETIAQYVGTELTALEHSKLPGVTSNPAESTHVPKAMIKLPQRNFITITYNLQLEGSSYKVWEVISENAADKIVEAVAGPDPSLQTASQNMAAGMGQTMVQQGGAQMSNMMGGMQGGMMNGMGGMNMGMQPNNQGGMPMMGMQANVQPVQFPPLHGFTNTEEQGNIGLIMDVYMEMTVELGRTKRMIKEILGMGEGHIIELDKLAGEPVDVLVNHKPIAKGEVVVIEESFGVRITEILSPAERIADV